MAHEDLKRLFIPVATVLGFITLMFILDAEGAELETPEQSIEPPDLQTRMLIQRRMEAGIVDKSVLAELFVALQQGDVDKYNQLLEYAKHGRDI